MTSLRRPLLAAALLLAGAAAVALVGLPVLARARLHDRLSALGAVRSLHVDGLSGLGLVRGHPTALDVHLATLDPAEVRGRSGELTQVPTVDLRADSVAAGPLTLRDVALTKHDDDVRVSARTTVGAAGGPALVAQDGRPALRIDPPQGVLGGAGAHGGLTVPLVARDGAVYADTSALPVGGGERLLFSAPELAVDDLAAVASGDGVVLRARGHLRSS